MADEGSNIARSHRELNRSVDQVGEVGDAVFENIVADLENTRGVLEEGLQVNGQPKDCNRLWCCEGSTHHFWRLMHLKGTIKQAILRYSSIRVDDQDDFTHSNLQSNSLLVSCFMEMIWVQTTYITSSPRPSPVELDLGLSCLIVQVLFGIEIQVSLCATVSGAFLSNQAEPLVFHSSGKVEAVVHVGRFLELALAQEEFLSFLSAVFWTRAPSNAVKLIVCFSGCAKSQKLARATLKTFRRWTTRHTSLQQAQE